MNLKTISLFCGALLTLSLSSCQSISGSDPEEPQKPIYTFEQKASDCFIAVQNLGNYEWNYYEGCTTTVYIDENDNTCSVQLADLKYGENLRTTLTLLNIPQSSFKDPNVKGAIYPASFTVSSAATLSSYIVSDLRIECLLDADRTFGSTVENGVTKPTPVGIQTFISFTIDNRYKIRVMQRNNYFYGLTSSVCSNGDFDPFHTQNSKYRLNLNPETKKARLTIENAQFVTGMPSGITMDFADIMFSINENGVTLESASLIPTAMNRPFEAYEVTYLRGNVSYAGKLTLSFTCPHVPIPMNSDDTYSFSVTVDAPYSLTSR